MTDKPFDARTATRAEVDAKMKEFGRDEHRRRAEAASARVIADMTRKHATKTN